MQKGNRLRTRALVTSAAAVLAAWAGLVACDDLDPNASGAFGFDASPLSFEASAPTSPDGSYGSPDGDSSREDGATSDGGTGGDASKGDAGQAIPDGAVIVDADSPDACPDATVAMANPNLQFQVICLANPQPIP